MYESFPIVQLKCPNTPSPEYEFFNIEPFDDLNFQPENVDMAGVEAEMPSQVCFTLNVGLTI